MGEQHTAAGPSEHDPFEHVELERLHQRRTVKWSLYGPDVLAAWVAEMDFDVAPPITAALHRAVDREDFGYVEADLSELTAACAEVLEDLHGWTVSPARIFPVSDVLTGLTAALEVFSPAGTPVVVPTPAYPPFFEVVELTGRPVVPAPMARHGDTATWTLDLDVVDATLADGARTVLLCNPHNPTGRVFTHDELAALAEVVDRHGARVVADEVHAPLVLAGARHVPYASVSDAAAQHTITLRSASKAWNLAGLKCAQVVASNHHDAATWRQLSVFAVAGPTPLGVAASVAAYREAGEWRQGLVSHLDRQRARLRDLLDTHLPGARLTWPEATFLSWIDCSELGLDDPAAHFLRHGAVALSDGPPFGAGNEQFVRLNFATSSTLLDRLVERLGAALAAQQPAKLRP